MTTLLRRAVLFPIAGLSLLFALSVAHADPNTQTAAQSQVQVDGITSGVVDNLWRYTDYYWHHGDYPRIIALDRVITEADPHFLEPYSTGGWLMESMGNNADAEAYYKLGVERNPDESYLYHMLGFFYFNTLHDYPKAVAAFHTGSEKADSDINCWRMLAHAYNKNHQYSEALATWVEIKKRWPDGSAVDHNLEEAREILAKSQANGSGAQPNISASP